MRLSITKIKKNIFENTLFTLKYEKAASEKGVLEQAGGGIRTKAV